MDVAGRAAAGAAGVVLVVAADLLDLLEGNRDERGRSQLVFRRHPRGDDRVQGQHAPRAGDDQRDPGEEEDDVRAGVVRRGVEAHRQEERQGEDCATGGRHPRPQAEQRAQTDGQLGQGDDDADGHSEAEEVSEERVQRADPDGRDQLRLNARWARRVQKVRVGQLLEPCEAEGEAEERPQRQHGPAGEGVGPWWWRVEAHASPSSSRGRARCRDWGPAGGADGPSPLCHEVFSRIERRPDLLHLPHPAHNTNSTLPRRGPGQGCPAGNGLAQTWSTASTCHAPGRP